VIADVAEQRLHIGFDQFLVGMFEPPADIDQGRCRLAQVQKLAPQPIEAMNLVVLHGLVQHAVFDAVDLALHGVEDRHVVVDDEIEDRVEDVVLSTG
jgi:hypothetical protein